MWFEIHSPELAQRVRAELHVRRLQSTDELLEQALDALDEKCPASTVPTAARHESGRRSLVEVFAPLRGLDLDFSRKQSGGRTIDRELS